MKHVHSQAGCLSVTQHKLHQPSLLTFYPLYPGPSFPPRSVRESVELARSSLDDIDMVQHREATTIINRGNAILLVDLGFKITNHNPALTITLTST